MKYSKTLLLFLLSIGNAIAQDYSAFTAHTAEIQKLPAIADAVERASMTEKLWQKLKEQKSIPIAVEDSVIFLYKGSAQSVVWMGDFNGWGYDKKFKNTGTQLPGTDLWMLKTSFPKDARLDYKILVNGTEWIIDDANPHQQWSGVGGGSPNSELRMPYWKPDPITEYQEGIVRGKLEKDILFNSKSLGYQIMYNVYLPASYSSSHHYPVAFVTDGYEYLHERLGNMQVILDNLIAQKKIAPVVVVFIDHREPVNRSNNRRMSELAMNEKYLSFFEQEFLPHIQSRYSVTHEPKERAIIGTSMGGLTSAYFAFAKPGVFGMTGIQSPAFWFKPDIYKVCDNPENPPVKIYMTTGVINDAQDGTRRMKEILERNSCTFQYTENNQGHSWGNWRDLIDDIMIYFFPPK